MKARATLLTLASAAALVAGTSPASATTITSFAGGRSTGDLRAAKPSKTATCKTPAVAATDHLCNFKLMVKYFEAAKHHGTMAGALMLDSTKSSSTHCSTASGSLAVTVYDHSGTLLGTLNTTLKSSSTVCTTSTATVNNFTFNESVSGGTGAYVNATGSLAQSGTLTDRTTDTYGKVYAEAGSFSGTITS